MFNMFVEFAESCYNDMLQVNLQQTSDFAQCTFWNECVTLDSAKIYQSSTNMILIKHSLNQCFSVGLFALVSCFPLEKGTSHSHI